MVRPVPHAIGPEVEEEMDHLQQATVIEKVKHSMWVAQIVHVLNKLRIYGNDKPYWQFSMHYQNVVHDIPHAS